MKKIIITVFVIFAIAIVCSFTIPCFFEDRIFSENSSVVTIGDNEGSKIITHITENGEKIECSFSIDEEKISDNYYKYTFLFNQDNSGKKYDIANLSLHANLGYGISVSDAFGSSGGNNFSCITAIGDSFEFKADENYLYITTLVYKEYPEEKIDITLRYSIKGKGLYSKNNFTGIEHNFIV